MAEVSQIKLPNGSVYDLVDEKSGYITAQYIENITDTSITIARTGTTQAGITVIGTDSTNFPTSKAVVEYVEDRLDDGYITLNDLPIDESIPVSEVNEAAVGDSVGTESTNLPTSKAVVEYVERRFSELIYDESMEDIP